MFALFIALFFGTAFGQVVFVGQQATKTEFDKFCNNEKIQPNLVLGQPTHVHGRITDIAGIPLKKSRVELRDIFPNKNKSG